MAGGQKTAFGTLLALALFLSLVAGILWATNFSATGSQARQGWTALRDGRYSEAVALFESVLNGPNNTPVPGFDPDLNRLGLSYAYLARRDFTRAAAVLPKTAPLAPWAELQRGIAAALGGDNTSATQIWRDLLARPDLPMPVYHATLWHLAQTSWPQESDALTQLAAIQAPGDPYVAAANLRQAQLAAPHDDAAARAYLDAAAATLPLVPMLAAAPDMNLSPDFSEGFSEDLLNQRLTEMKAALDQAAPLRASGVSQSSLDALWGREYDQQEEWALARELLASAAAAQPEVADIHAYLGLSLQRLGQTADAERELLRAIALDPKRVLGQHLLARLYLEQQRWEDAKPHLEAALAEEPNNVVLHLDIAGYYTSQAAYIEAEAEYVQAEQLQLAFGSSKEVNTSLLLANFYLERNFALGGCELSREAARRAISNNPGSDEYDALGWAQRLCGNPDQAIEALRAAIKLNPRSARAHYHLGVLLKETGQPAPARRELELAQDCDPGGIWEQRALSAIVRP